MRTVICRRIAEAEVRNFTINAFTQDYKSATTRLAALCRTHSCTRMHTCIEKVYRGVIRAAIAKRRPTDTLSGFTRKSLLWGIRLLVAKHRYIAFRIAQRASVWAAAPIQQRRAFSELLKAPRLWASVSRPSTSLHIHILVLPVAKFHTPPPLSSPRLGVPFSAQRALQAKPPF